MLVLLAASPIAVVLLAMGILRWGAAPAGAAGLAVAIALAFTVFDFTASTGGAIARSQAAAGAMAEAFHGAAVILWIIFPALAIYELQRRTGALDRIRSMLAHVSEDFLVQVLLTAWFFGLFMEGAAGFGTPVALAAPILVGIGVRPAQAVALALICHAAGVSFGAVGTPVYAQAEITGIDAASIGAATAPLNALLGMILLIVAARLAGAGLTLRTATVTCFAAACFFIPYLLLALFAGPELPTLGGALIGGTVFAAVMRPRNSPRAAFSLSRMRDFAPYAVILCLVLVTRLISPASEFLTGIALEWTLHGVFEGSFQPLYHPGTILMIGLLVGAFLAGSFREIPAAMLASARRLAFVAVALLVMLVLSRVMVHAGMISALANAATQTGAFWPLLAPAVGVLGTFVTGSATASNILFTELQLRTAEALSLPQTSMLGGQGVGAAAGNMIAPHNIIAGAATVNLKGEEGDILARTITVCVVYTAAAGAALWVLTLLG
jgi:lactate permease